MSPGLMRRDFGGLANETYLSKPIVSSRQYLRGDIPMASTLGGGKNEMLTWMSNLYYYFFFIKENWISAMIRHRAESDEKLLTRKLSLDSGVRQWNYPLMIPLLCLWLNRTIKRVVNLNVMGLDFVFVLIWFVHMYSAVIVPEFVGEDVWGGFF